MSFAPKQFIRSVDFLSTENAINTSTGCVNIFGGMSVSRDSYLTNMIVVGNSTVTNLNITGTLTTSNGNSLVSSQWTSIDSNTDIYFGTSSNSFVGIGTTTPTFNLDISGGSRITGALTVGNLNVNTGASITNILNTTICTGTVIITAGSIRASFNSHTIGNIFTTGGNVGINTTTPGSRLEVNGTLKANDITVGNINFTGNLFQNGSAYLGSQWTTTSGNTLTYTSGNISVNSGFTSSFNSNTIGNIFTTGGNIGIGTTAPTSILDVVNSSPLLILRTSSLTEGKIYFGNSNHGIGRNPSISTLTHGNDVALWTGGGGASIGFATLLTERMRITDTGNVGIGTISPGATLDVSGTTRLQNDFGITANSAAWNSTLTKGLHMRYSTNGAQDAGYIQSIDRSTNTWYPLSIQARQLTFTTNGGDGSERMIITSTGNIGIGTTAPAYTLDINGTIDATTYTGGIVSVTSITTATIRVTGNADLSTGLTTVTDLTGTNITSGTIRASTLISTANLSAGNITGGNIRATNLTSSVIQTTGITTGTIRVTGNADLSTGLTTVTDLSGTNITSGTIRASTLISTANLSAGSITGGSILIHNSSTAPTTLFTRYSTNISGGSLNFGEIAWKSTQRPFNNAIIRSTSQVSDGLLGWDDAGRLEFLTQQGARNPIIRMVISEIGNVGIGTTEPSRMLSLSGPSTNVTAGPHLWINTSDQTNPVFQMMNWSADNVSMNFDMYYDGAFRNSGSSTAWQLYKIGSQLKFMYQNGTAGSSNGQTNCLVLGSSGNVGIGTATPAYTLDINGTIDATTYTGGSVSVTSITTSTIRVTGNADLSTGLTTVTDLTCTNITSGTIRAIGNTFLTSTTTIFNTVNNYNLNSGALNLSGDTVISGSKIYFTTTAIGVPTMNGRGAGSKIILFPETGPGLGDYAIGIENANMWFQVPDAARGFKFYQGTTANLVMTGGNVGIGTITPSHTLDVNGTGRVTGTLLAINNSNTLGNIFTTGGNVGIGTTTPGRPLTVNTAIRIGGSSPVLDFVDTTTQIYRGSTLSELRFVTNSVDRITVTSSGNVGIGINAPSQILHIQRSGTDNYLKIDAGGTSTNYSGIMLTEYNINWGWSMRHNALTDLLHISYQDNTPAFTDMLTFTRSGNVGINTTAPAYTLDVNGTTRISSSITTPLIYGDNNSSLTIYNTVAINNTNTNIRETVLQLRRPGTVSQSYSGIADFNMTRYAISGTRAKTRLDIDLSGEFLGDTTSTIMSLQSNGYVGIGTTAPAYTLDINGTIDATTYTGGIVSVTSITTATIRVTGNADLSTGLTTVTDLTGTNITSGTIRASTLISTANLSAGAITGGTIRITTSLLAIGNSNTLGNIFTTGGNVGIGTISPSYPLHVSGDIYATGDVISFSDARLKTDVVTIENALDKVSGLRGVYYTNTNTNTRETGVIAQEIAEILPEVVADRGEYLGVAYGNIVGILIEAIKELKARVSELENR